MLRRRMSEGRKPPGSARFSSIAGVDHCHGISCLDVPVEWIRRDLDEINEWNDLQEMAQRIDAPNPYSNGHQDCLRWFSACCNRCRSALVKSNPASS
jgi:hypothetical protein